MTYALRCLEHGHPGLAFKESVCLDLRSIHRSRRQHDRDPDVNMARTGAFVFTATNIPRLFLRVSMIRVLAVVTNRVLNH